MPWFFSGEHVRFLLKSITKMGAADGSVCSGGERVGRGPWSSCLAERISTMQVVLHHASRPLPKTRNLCPGPSMLSASWPATNIPKAQHTHILNVPLSTSCTLCCKRWFTQVQGMGWRHSSALGHPHFSLYHGIFFSQLSLRRKEK